MRYLLLVLLLSGCAERIDGWEFMAISEFCKDKGGIDHVNLVISTRVVCRDGDYKFLVDFKK